MLAPRMVVTDLRMLGRPAASDDGDESARAQQPIAEAFSAATRAPPLPFSRAFLRFHEPRSARAPRRPGSWSYHRRAPRRRGQPVRDEEPAKRATTMGFSALDGLRMGARTGSLDPDALLDLMGIETLTLEEVSSMLYN